MDILVLLAQLDDTFRNAKPMPLSGHLLIDEEEVGEILRQMRGAIPDEIRQAPWIVEDGQERLAEAERMLEEAREARASSLAGVDAEDVRGIIEAAGRTAAEIRSNAERDAQRLTRNAQQAAEETRRDGEQQATEITERTEAEAAARLERIEQATGKMLEGARGVESALDGLAENLRTSIGSLVASVRDRAGSLSTRLEQRRNELSEVGAGTIARREPAVVGPVDVATDVVAEVQETTAEAAYDEAGTGELEPTREPSQAVEPGRAEERAAGAGGAAPFDFERPGRDQPAAARGGGVEGARLIALNMARNRTPRGTTRRFLSENFDLDDPEAILDEVYARVGR